MQGTIVKGYEGSIEIGQRALYVMYGSGPASYSQTTGDVFLAPAGFYVDYLAGSQSVSKNYYVRAYPNAVGSRATWTWKWYTAAGVEVTGATDLSAEKVQFLVIGGAF